MGELPAGWKKVKLEQFAFVNMGQSPKGIFVNQNGDGLPFYQGKRNLESYTQNLEKIARNRQKSQKLTTYYYQYERQ